MISFWQLTFSTTKFLRCQSHSQELLALFSIFCATAVVHNMKLKWVIFHLALCSRPSWNQYPYIRYISLQDKLDLTLAWFCSINTFVKQLVLNSFSPIQSPCIGRGKVQCTRLHWVPYNATQKGSLWAVPNLTCLKGALHWKYSVFLLISQYIRDVKSGMYTNILLALSAFSHKTMSSIR